MTKAEVLVMDNAFTRKELELIRVLVLEFTENNTIGSKTFKKEFDGIISKTDFLERESFDPREYDKNTHLYD